MREGVSRDGSHLFAAFPFNAYTELQEDDVKELYAYLMTRPAVNATVPPKHGSVSSQRPLSPGGMESSILREAHATHPIRQKMPNGIAEHIWLRRSAIVGAVIRRAMRSAVKSSDAYAGTVVDNWIAPPLTEANPSPVPWTQESCSATSAPE